MSETITSETAAEPPAPSAASSAWRTAARVGWITAWVVVAVLGWVTLSRWWGFTIPARVTVLLQALVPLVYLPVYAIGVIAFVRRRWALGAACVLLALVHIAAVYPALGHRDPPAWAASAPRLTALEANVYDQNAQPQQAAAKIMGSGADVLVLVEMDSSLLNALRLAGIDQAYPYSTLGSTRYRANVIWSKQPLQDVHAAARLNDVPWATVELGGRSLLLLAVHVDNAIRGRDEWSRQLHDLGAHAASTDGPVALVGDFNATRWNPPFGDLLGQGLHDAHEAVGQGLSRSWPNLGRLAVPVMRLDHALVNDRVAVLSVHDVDIPGSDHVGFVTELAID